MSTKSNNQLITFSTIPLISIVVGFLLALVIAVVFVQNSATSSHREALIDQAADSAQARINQAQLKLLNQANNMATSIRLTELVANADASARALEESRLRELIPNAVRVRMIRMGEAQVNRDADPPFTYTSLDLVNKAEQGETVYPEAINANGRWVIGLVAPIKPPSSETIRGTLFVYLDTAALIDEISEGLNGSVTIVQAFNANQSNEFLKVGETSDLVIERSLINEIWQLRFSPTNDLTEANVGSVFSQMLPLLVFLIVAIVGVLFGIGRVIKTFHSDASLLQNQIADVMNGTHSVSTHFSLGEFKEIDALLSRLGKKEREKPDVKPLNVTSTPKPTGEITVEDMDTESEALPPLDADDDAPALDLVETETTDLADTDLPDVASIFRAYDIRGVVGQTLTKEVAYRIGQTIGTQADDLGETKIIVGADGRLSSPEILNALTDGLVATGREVINIGFVPTPLLYFATHNSEATSGVMVTGSHNPADHNGMKIVLGGKTLVGEDIEKLYELYMSGEFVAGEGELTEIDIRDDYLDAIADDVVVAQPLKVVLDCGNGIAGDLAPDLLGSLGCEVIALYCDVDGHFPNHHPDPIVPENLADLILTVKSEQADLGIALDGDGDRMVAVTGEGEIIWPDRLLMLFAKDVVSRNPGSDVVYDVKCTRHLNSVISGFGGRPVVSRSGHSYVKAKMQETDAILGGELSGHICFQERWYGFDDGLYAAARLLEIVGTQSEGLAELLEEFPTSIATPEITIPVAESRKFDLMNAILDKLSFEDATVTDIDGLRVDFSNGWGLVRASNTTASLTLRFEADDEVALESIKNQFREQLASIDAGLQF